MKHCPNCQTKYADDFLQYCLQCGMPLQVMSDGTPKKMRRASNAAIITALLGGFAVLAIGVGGLGAFYFSRSNEKNEKSGETVVSNDKSNLNSNSSQTAQNQDLKKPSVERLNQNQTVQPPMPGNDSSAAEITAKQVVVSASSVRRSDDKNFYFPSLAFDKNPATAWCEGVAGAGAGEWLQFEFNQTMTLRQIKIDPGYFKNRDVWAKNNRVARISVQFSDGSQQEFSLTDSMQTQSFEIGRINTKSVKITILEVFKGTSDADDTLISEVSFVAE